MVNSRFVALADLVGGNWPVGANEQHMDRSCVEFDSCDQSKVARVFPELGYWEAKSAGDKDQLTSYSDCS